MEASKRKIIGIWLLVGVFMILIQIIIGGITRLTGSGLSITKWEILIGALPPLNADQWNNAFDLYKESPQYKMINKGMDISQFKFIYFWEYFHRLWARLLGIVFLVPFVFFLIKKWLTPALKIKALIAFGLGALVGVFGWIMVASGLVDRPMVSPYRLAAHLSLAIVTLMYLLWVALGLMIPAQSFKNSQPRLRKWAISLFILISIQIIIGALVSGMHAATFYPTWPDMNGELIPGNLFHLPENGFPIALVQFLHRNLAYIISILIIVFLVKAFRKFKSGLIRNILVLIPVILILQVGLGIFTLINSIGSVPVDLGVAHQAVAVILLSSFLAFIYLVSGYQDQEKSRIDDFPVIDH